MTDILVAFDTETSGLDTQNDYIIELGLVKFNAKSKAIIEALKWYIKPSGPFEISPDAQEIHGISKEFLLENGVLLKDIWQEALDFIGDCDILSYNGNHFDVPMLYYNLLREHLSFDFENHKFYDAYTIERKRNSNKLTDVYKRYTGEDFENAHDALADVKATITVFGYQCDQCPDLIEDDSFNIVSPEGFIKLTEKGELVFTTGKYKGKTTNEICETDPTYIKWIFEKFSNCTRNSIKKAWYAEHPKK